jgi:hypothetical protein
MFVSLQLLAIMKLDYNISKKAVVVKRKVEPNPPADLASGGPELFFR